MTILVEVRGNIYDFTATFLDVDDLPVIPAYANLYISFLMVGTVKRTKITIAMTVVGQSYFATWDSSEAAPCKVNWSVRSVGPHTAEDGSFNLTANLANTAAP